MSKIKLSKVAKEVLSQTINESEIPTGKGLRLKEFEGGLTLTIDSPSKDDRIVRNGDKIILIVDRKLEQHIGESTIDISNIRKKPKLVIMKQKRGMKLN